MLTPSITLRITTSPGSSLPEEAVKVFDIRGGTIGRAEGSDWVLPDPTRQVSGRHATVSYDSGKFRLSDTSSNGVFVNGDDEPLGSSRIVDLNDGDRLTIGGYQLVVGPAESAPSAATTRPVATAPAVAPSALQSGEAGKASVSLDPLALLREAEPQAAISVSDASVLATTPSDYTTKDASAAPSIGVHAPRTAGPQPLASLALGCEQPVDPLQLLDEAGVSASPIALKRHAPLAGIAAQRDDAPIVSSHFRAPATLELVPEDWEAHAVAAIDPPPALPSTPSQCAIAARPVGARDIPSSSPGIDGGECAAERAPEPVAALRVFLGGAGLDASLAEKLDAPRTLELAGRLLREAVGGMRELLLARATLKTGFHVPVTLIAPKDNNPLKFSAGGVCEVIETLLLDRGRAYLSAVEAMQEGLEDLKDHQMALIAGVRSSLDGLLESFDPARIEEATGRIGKRGLLSNRKAICWDVYCARYEETTKAAEDRFRDLFGKPFAAGYQHQARKLAETRAADSREIRNGME